MISKNNYQTPAFEYLNVNVEFGFASSTEQGSYGIDATDMEFGGEF